MSYTSSGGTTLAAGAPTTITVSGRGFQSIAGGFGGIYVMFGWVSDPGGMSWRPSQGGSSGSTYRFVQDSQEKDNQGYLRFVSFPGSETEASANGGVVDADGSFQFTMVIPGAVITVPDAAGNLSPIDCRQETCGLITLGAHGVVNTANESFTPVHFGGGSAADAGAAAGQPGAGTAEGSAAQGTAGGGKSGAAGAVGTAQGGPGSAADAAASAAAPPAEATVGVDQSTAVAGRVLTFTGQGFAPGEQVVASLDNGLAAVGPLTAGPAGDVAGILTLPADIRLGTHALTLEAASSGQRPSAQFTVTRDPAAAAPVPPAPAAASGGSEVWGAYAAAAAGLLFLVMLVWYVSAVRRRRKATAGEPEGSVLVPAAQGPDHPAWPAVAPEPGGPGGRATGQEPDAPRGTVAVPDARAPRGPARRGGAASGVQA